MVIDSSAIAAVLFGESDASRYIDALAAPGRKFMSAMTRLECAIVINARKGEIGLKAFSRLLAAIEIEIIAFDSGQAEIAHDAWRRYGKGRHEAGLNMGDCASYSLAKLLNDKLLYKGGDFSKTDAAAVF